MMKPDERYRRGGRESGSGRDGRWSIPCPPCGPCTKVIRCAMEVPSVVCGSGNRQQDGMGVALWSETGNFSLGAMAHYISVSGAWRFSLGNSVANVTSEGGGRQ